MKSRQVGFVLMALIAIGVAGLIVRVVSAGSSELVLSGILPITPDVIQEVEIRSQDRQVRLVKREDVWLVDQRQPAFEPKLNLFWQAVADIDGAQLIAANPANHRRMGVADGQGVEVSFRLTTGGFEQERFIIGKWTPDVRLCYLRRPARHEVYGIPCPAPNIFDPNPDGWRNPIVTSIPRSAVDSVEFEYPDERFALRQVNGEWRVVKDGQEQPADLAQVGALLSSLEAVFASGFADEQTAAGLDFTGPSSTSVRVVTRSGSQYPTTRLRFLQRDAISYYVRTPVQETVFIVDQNMAGAILKKSADLQAN